MYIGKERIHRTNNRRLLGGVFSGIGEYLHVNPNIFRTGWVMFTLLFTLVGILAYAALFFFIPHKNGGILKNTRL